MATKVLGIAVFRCSLCGKMKELAISSDKDSYKHDYSSLLELAHKCEPLATDKVPIGKLELKGIYFTSETVTVDAEDDAIISLTHPPLRINWKETNAEGLQ